MFGVIEVLDFGGVPYTITNIISMSAFSMMCDIIYVNEKQ